MREVELLARWRRENQHAFFDRLGVTEEGTRRWLQNMQEKVRDRILFFFGDGKKYVGHIGLFRFDCHTEYAELDNLILGDRSGVDYAGPACVRIMEWARDELGLKGVHARILASNKPALLFNNMLGMREINRTPLRSIQVKGGTSLRPLYIPGYNAADDYVVTMKLSFNEETA
ncbi:MAG: GNAT family N-acetyltransferase [Planctomycetes bacterium]|nr:GNAT family N-acetyltransferase [Planctomycetota bacterium]